MPNLLLRLGVDGLGQFHASLLAAGADVERFGKITQGALFTTAQSSRKFQHDLGIGMVATGAVVAAGFAVATKSAIDFEKAMRNVQTIATLPDKLGNQVALTESQFQDLSKSVVQLSTTVPQSAEVLAKALYDIVSVGFQGAAAMSVLRASAVAASAGLTDAQTAAAGITTVLNAYGKSGFEAAKVSSILFEAVNVGGFSFEGLTQNLGQFVGIAAQAKIPIEAVSAALATISLAGNDASESSVQLNRVIQAFIAPSAEMAQEMHILGISVADLSDPAVGLEGVFKKLQSAVGGNIEALHTLFPEMRAFRGAAALMIDGGAQMNKIFGDFADPAQVAIAASNAFNEQAKGTAFQLGIAGNEVKAVGIELGDRFAPAVAGTAKLVGGFATGIAGLPGPVKDLGTGVLILGGGIALVGGAALLSVPKFLAMKAAIQGVVLTEEEAAVTGAAMFGPVAIGIAAVTAVLGFAAVATAKHGQAEHDAAAQTENYTQALLAQKNGIEDATAAQVQQDLVQKGVIDNAVKAGFSVKQIADLLVAANPAASGSAAAYKRTMDLISDGLNKIDSDTGKFTKTQIRMRDALIAIGDDSGVFVKMREANEAGLPAADRLYKAQQLNANAAADTKGAIDSETASMVAQQQAADALSSQIDAMVGTQKTVFDALGKLPGVDLSVKTSGSSSGSSESPERRALNIEKAVAAVAKATRDQAKAQQDLNDAQKNGTVQMAFARAERDLAAAYDGTLRATMSLKSAEQALEDQRRNAASGRTAAEASIAVQRATAAASDANDSVVKAQQDLNDAMDHGSDADIVKAQRSLVEARNAMREATWGAQDAQLALTRAQGDGGTISQNLQKAELDVNDAQRGLAESADSVATAQQGVTQAMRDAANNQAVVDATQTLTEANFSLRDAVLGVADATKQTGSASSSAGSGFDALTLSIGDAEAAMSKNTTSILNYSKNLLKIKDVYGPAAEAAIASLGINASKDVQAMADDIDKNMYASGQGVKHTFDGFATAAERSAIATSKAFNAAISAGFGGSVPILNQYLLAMAQQTGISVADIEASLRQMGIAFEEVATGTFQITGNEKAGFTVTGTNTLGERTTAHVLAEGDIANGHHPEIARGGAMRVWAEPETMGESYIPHANDHRRPRAINLWEQTGRVLGVYAQGGVNWSSVRPSPHMFDSAPLARLRAPAYSAAMATWQMRGAKLAGYGIKTYAEGGMTPYKGGGGGRGNSSTLVNVAAGAVKVDVRVAADADKNSVRSIVEGAVMPAFDKLMERMTDEMVARGS